MADDTQTGTGPRDMSRWLGDGGMPVMAAIGATFEEFGAEPGGEGWSSARWIPTELACNPQGVVQAGIHGVVLDAAMNFAVNAALASGDRSRATLEMKTETMRPAVAGQVLGVRGRVVRMARQVAYAEGTVRDDEQRMVSRSTGTFLLQRRD